MNPQLELHAFGKIESERILALDDLFAVVSDKFPISPGHTLIIARRALPFPGIVGGGEVPPASLD